MSEFEWIRRYTERLIELGYDKDFARDTALTVDIDSMDCDPEEAADNEYSCAVQS